MADNGKPYKVIVNGFVFNFTREELDKVDLLKRSPTEYHLLKDHQSINAKLLHTDLTGKNMKIETDGETFDITIKDELDEMQEKMGLGAASTKRIKQIKAPMPGLVLEIAVTDGQAVNEGDKLIILEAMKMENSIMSHADAKVKKVVVAIGQAVEKGQVLVELE